MKILVINGDCIQTNTSANLCHIAYINGLVESGHEVTLLSADGRDYQLDSSIVIPESVKGYTYYGVSFYEKLALRKKRGSAAASMAQTSVSAEKENTHQGDSIKTRVVKNAKKLVLSSYGVHGIYAKFVKAAQQFHSDVNYDFVISISTPVTSHLLTHNLLKAKHIKAFRWIQIWEDPWFGDAYGFNYAQKIYKEEKRLLSFAEKVCYVSPLTLKNRQELFPESAHKMYWQPLPYYYKNDTVTTVAETNSYGYFGDYAPVSRDLKPFYEAAKQSSIQVNICGSPNNLFASTDSITIYPRLPLDKLKPIEDKTNVLIFLCNRKGGQIPGKIYQYSATYKTILFILDGTDEEKKVLREYFEKFNRYVFCENTVEDITRAINDIENGNIGSVKNEPVEAFNPKETIRKILAGEMG